MEIPVAVYAIWWATLIVAVVVVLPLAVYLLHRALMAARQIERYAERSLRAGEGIAENTGDVEALQNTISTATNILDAAGNIRRHTRTLEETFERRAG